MSRKPQEYRGNNPQKPRVDLDKISDIVEADRKGCRDTTHRFDRLRFMPAEGTPKNGEGNALEINDVPHVFTEHSWKQFCSYVGVPEAYANKIDADERKRVFGYWFEQHSDKRAMLRLRNIPKNGKPEQNLIRAVVPPTNSRFDHHVMLDHLRKISADLVVHTFYLDDFGMTLSLGDREGYDTIGGKDSVQRMAKLTVKNSDPIVFGMQLRNSEIDAYDFEVAQSVLRLVCTNGLVAWDPQASYAKSKKHGDILAFREACTDALHEMRQKTVYAVRLFREARATVYGSDGNRKDYQRVAASVFRTCGLSGRGELDEVLLRWERFPSGEPEDPSQKRAFTKHGLIDALTREAQKLEDRQKQYAWERAAGRLLASSAT